MDGLIESQWLVSVNVNGADLGIWDSFGGGDTTAKVAHHRPGGMGPEKLYRGLPTYAAVTVGRAYERARDHEQVRLMQTLVGVASMTVTKQPLDENRQAWGKPIVYRGKLSGVKPGKADSTSENVDMCELDCEVSTIA